MLQIVSTLLFLLAGGAALAIVATSLIDNLDKILRALRIPKAARAFVPPARRRVRVQMHPAPGPLPATALPVGA